MNKLLKTISIIFITIFLFAGNSFADWSLDITPNYGDQDGSDIIANIGDTVMYQLWFVPDPVEGTTVVSAYTWRLDFDETELALDLAGSTEYMFGTPYEWVSSPLKEEPAGYATAGAVSFSPGTSVGTDPFLMVDLAFTVIAPVDDDISDLIFDATVAGTAMGFYIQEGEEVVFNNAIHIAANHQFTDGADVAPVPIPGAVWLLGSCMLGLLGFNYKNKK